MDFPEILPQYAEIRFRFAHAFDGEVLLFTKKNGELVEHSSESISKEKPKISLNITKVFHSWITDNQPEIFVKLLDAKRVIFAQDFSIFGIVSYEGISPKSVPQRKKRSTSKESSKDGNVGYMSVNFDPLRAETDVNEMGCHRKGLYVNFNDLGWKDWVIAPEGFQSFLCDGGCSFPLHNKMNATNHAIVQTLVHLLHPQRAPSPRCAPSKLSQQKIIFIDNSENVVLKRYQDMIVQECGCQ
ncbi:unnamed protein product, partial [Mesorhabditis belari]|uniref:TGF-beta family profile domain-containing protein n=1 Tax=Mesorhabditis belari TaxID=2138241 RepID=A0AAF3FQR5_9BILA